LSSDLAPEIHGVTLVDYAATLRAPPPTWVAATLSEFAPS
jgi:hypothetical protein